MAYVVHLLIFHFMLRWKFPILFKFFLSTALFYLSYSSVFGESYFITEFVCFFLFSSVIPDMLLSLT